MNPKPINFNQTTSPLSRQAKSPIHSFFTPSKRTILGEIQNSPLRTVDNNFLNSKTEFSKYETQKMDLSIDETGWSRSEIETSSSNTKVVRNEIDFSVDETESVSSKTDFSSTKTQFSCFKTENLIKSKFSSSKTQESLYSRSFCKISQIFEDRNKFSSSNKENVPKNASFDETDFFQRNCRLDDLDTDSVFCEDSVCLDKENSRTQSLSSARSLSWMQAKVTSDSPNSSSIETPRKILEDLSRDSGYSNSTQKLKSPFLHEEQTVDFTEILQKPGERLFNHGDNLQNHGTNLKNSGNDVRSFGFGLQRSKTNLQIAETGLQNSPFFGDNLQSSGDVLQNPGPSLQNFGTINRIPSIYDQWEKELQTSETLKKTATRVPEPELEINPDSEILHDLEAEFECENFEKCSKYEIISTDSPNIISRGHSNRKINSKNLVFGAPISETECSTSFNKIPNPNATRQLNFDQSDSFEFMSPAFLKKRKTNNIMSVKKSLKFTSEENQIEILKKSPIMDLLRKSPVSPKTMLSPKSPMISPKFILGSPKFTQEKTKIAMVSPKCSLESPQLSQEYTKMTLVSPKFRRQSPKMKIQNLKHERSDSSIGTLSTNSSNSRLKLSGSEICSENSIESGFISEISENEDGFLFENLNFQTFNSPKMANFGDLLSGQIKKNICLSDTEESMDFNKENLTPKLKRPNFGRSISLNPESAFNKIRHSLFDQKSPISSTKVLSPNDEKRPFKRPEPPILGEFLGDSSSKRRKADSETENAVFDTENTVFGTGKAVFGTEKAVFGTEKAVFGTEKAVFDKENDGFDGENMFFTENAGFVADLVKCKTDSNLHKKINRPILQRAFSENNASIMSALARSVSNPELIGDFSLPFALPLTRGKHSDLKSISCDTLAELMSGSFKDLVHNYQVIDCRYPYEYSGGHIQGAVNIYTPEQVLTLMRTPCMEDKIDGKRNILVFHCEFSLERGPKLSRFLRSTDRAQNKEKYPFLTYPEVYLLDEGYRSFYGKHGQLCRGGYTPMLSPAHKNELRTYRAQDTNSFRKVQSMCEGKLQRNKSRSRLLL